MRADSHAESVPPHDSDNEEAQEAEGSTGMVCPCPLYRSVPVARIYLPKTPTRLHAVRREAQFDPWQSGCGGESRETDFRPFLSSDWFKRGLRRRS